MRDLPSDPIHLRIPDPPSLPAAEARRAREQFERLRTAGALMEVDIRQMRASIVEVR